MNFGHAGSGPAGHHPVPPFASGWGRSPSARRGLSVVAADRLPRLSQDQPLAGPAPAPAAGRRAGAPRRRVPTLGLAARARGHIATTPRRTSAREDLGGPSHGPRSSRQHTELRPRERSPASG